MEFITHLASVVIGAAIGILAEHFRGWILGADLRLLCELDTGLGTGSLAISETSVPGVRTCYLRVAVETANRFFLYTARGCQPFLMKIEREKSDGDYEMIFHDPLPLIWSCYGPGPRDLPPGVRLFFDVIEINSQDKAISPQVGKAHVTWARVLASSGRYRFTVAVSGDNARLMQLSFVVDWSGRWDNYSITNQDHLVQVTPERFEAILSQAVR